MSGSDVPDAHRSTVLFATARDAVLLVATNAAVLFAAARDAVFLVATNANNVLCVSDSSF